MGRVPESLRDFENQWRTSRLQTLWPPIAKSPPEDHQSLLDLGRRICLSCRFQRLLPNLRRLAAHTERTWKRFLSPHTALSPAAGLLAQRQRLVNATAFRLRQQQPSKTDMRPSSSPSGKEAVQNADNAPTLGSRHREDP